MDISLKGKHALVCGGSKGIGRAIASELASQGASVIIAARSADILEDLAGTLDASDGQDHGFLVVDMNQVDDVRQKVRNLALGRNFQILINNSGGPPGGPILEASNDEFLTAIKRHLLVSHEIVKLLTPNMKKGGYGRIINIISTSVKEPIPGLGVSNTTRGAVASWAKTMAMELGPFGITVNNVLPGFTRTDRLASIFEQWAAKEGISVAEFEEKMAETVPLKRLAEPNEVASVVAFLSSQAASYVNGVSLAVDGGRLRGI